MHKELVHYAKTVLLVGMDTGVTGGAVRQSLSLFWCNKVLLHWLGLGQARVEMLTCGVGAVLAGRAREWLVTLELFASSGIRDGITAEGAGMLAGVLGECKALAHLDL